MKDQPIPGHRERTEVTVAQWEDTGIWLPTKCYYERFENDELVLSEDTEIEFISVNKPIDKKLFEPISFSIKPGTNTYRYPNPSMKNYMWDGEKVVLKDNRKKEAISHKSQGPGLSIWILLANAIAFSVIALIFLYKSVRKSSQPLS